MKLVKIEHSRCGEYDGQTYVFAPDDWDEDKISTVLDEVITEHIEAAKELAQEEQPRPPFNPPYAQYPDKTVKEVQELHQKRKDEYKVWQAEHYKNIRSFAGRLEDHGFVRAHNVEDAVTLEAYWGHNHGLKLNYINDEDDW